MSTKLNQGAWQRLDSTDDHLNQGAWQGGTNGSNSSSSISESSHSSHSSVSSNSSYSSVSSESSQSVAAAEVITKTVMTSGGDYNSLSNWEAGQQGDIVSNNTIQIAECYNFVDTTTCVIDGWTTGSGNYIVVRGAASDKTSSNTGIFSTERYRLTGQLTVQEDYVYVEDIQLNVTDNWSLSIFEDFGAQSRHVVVQRVIIKDVGNHSWAGAARVKSNYDNWQDGSTIIFCNCLLLCNGGNDIGFDLSPQAGKDVNIFLYNNTVVNTIIGCYQSTGGDVVAINNLFYDCDNPADGTFIAPTDYNATEKSSIGYTVTGSGNTHDRVSQTFSFIDSGSENYHLASNDAGAMGHGLTDPGNGLFSNDIDGQTRIAPWDIGADEYIASSISSNSSLSSISSNSSDSSQSSISSNSLSSISSVSSESSISSESFQQTPLWDSQIWGRTGKFAWDDVIQGFTVSNGAIITSPYGDLLMYSDATGVYAISNVWILKNSTAHLTINTSYIKGTATIQIRGQLTSFLKTDELPSWSNYTTSLNVNWKYMQLRIRL